MQVSPEVVALYNIIETNFKPMTIVKDAQPLLHTLSTNGTKEGQEDLAT